MNWKDRLSVLLAIFLFVSTSSLAVTRSEDIVIGKRVNLHSKILDEDRTIYIHTPEGYEDGDEEYPVLFILDGMPYFQLAMGILKYHTMFYVLPKMIVVGIPNTDRIRDLTPTRSNIYKGKEVDWLKNTGGADNMLQFMEEELFHYIETNYRTQPFRIIAGHSFGGLFAVHALLSQPELFNAYFCISTSFWFDNNVLTRRSESIMPSIVFLSRFLYLSVGGEESSMQINANHEFVSFLREQRPEGLTWTFDYLIGEDGILLIDSQFEEVSEKIKSALSELGGGQIKFVLNTNWHYDHVNGNAIFGNDGAVVVAHEKTRERMAAEQFYPDFNMKNPAYPEHALPKICVTDSMKLHFNKDEIRILHTKNAHSDADLIFYFQKANVLHTGDILFSEGYPYIDVPSGGSITGMIQAAKKIMGMIDEDTKIIPGHGRLACKKDLERNIKVLTAIRDRIQKLIDDGKTLEEVVASKPTADLDKENSGAMSPDFFVTIVYNDLTGKHK